MRIPPGRFSFVFTLSTLFLISALPSFASDDSEVREVRISSVQGDVRLSRGDGKHVALNKPWERAQGGELLERGFAVATGNGRAEIEFENGSTAFLAENSLLLFPELSAPRDRIVTRMTLPTGSATFSLQPAAGETFFIETPTDKLEITAPDAFFARMDAYLDATPITPQGEKGERMTCNYILGTPFGKLEDASPDTSSTRINIYIGRFTAFFSQVEEGEVAFRDVPKGQTMFFRGCEVVHVPDPAQAVLSKELIDWLSLELSDLQTTASALKALGLAPLVPAGLLLQSLPNVRTAIPQTSLSQTAKEDLGSAANRSPASSNWDNWVSSRVQERGAITTAALRASGLSTPIPGLADLYAHGSFFQCEPYRTCWEPTSEEQQQEPSPQTSQPDAQGLPPNAANVGFQPQLVEWVENTWGPCDLYTSRNVSRVASTPEELQRLLRLRLWAESHAFNNGYSSACNYNYLHHGSWIPHHHGYALVLPVKAPPGCKTGTHCKPVHPPRPLFVRVGDKVGLVPRHPNDVKGKPPLNLKNGILVPPPKPGQRIQRVTVDSSQKFKILDRAPRQFQSGFVTHSLLVVAPEIRGHLMQETARGPSTIVASHADSHIVYDYKSQKFLMPAATAAGAKAREVPVGGIAHDGKVASFADGHSGRYADSFGRTSAAASYNGGHNSGASYSGRSLGSYSSGASYSGGGGYSGSHSSGSYGGSSSHSSGASSGGGSVSTSSSSSSSASSSSSGGGSRGRP